MKKLIALCIAAACAAPLMASAQDAGPYALVDLGISQIDGLNDRLGVGAAVGYKVNRFFAAELSLRRFGNWENTDVNLIQASVLGSVPLSKDVSAYVRLGYGHNRFSRDSLTASENRALYGVGGEYNVSASMAVRAEYTRIYPDAGQFNVGLKFKF
jgi:opacity protein-like surface antigen